MSGSVAPSPGSSPAAAARRSPVRWLLLAVAVGIAALWVYALWFAPRTATYRVSDDAWRAGAEQVCAEAKEQRLALADTSEGMIFDPTPEQMVQRAGLVDRATDLLEGALDRIVALPLDTERDRALVADFDRYYRAVISDRRAHVERLRSLDDSPYYETAFEGGPVSNTVNDFVIVNQIPSCAPPTDLAPGA